MHILDRGEAAIAAYLKATGITREELEAAKAEDDALVKEPAGGEVPRHTQEKMGAYFEFDILDEEPGSR